MLILRARQKAAADPAKRARALEVARTSGLLALMGDSVIQPTGSGWAFRLRDAPTLSKLRTRLRSQPTFRDGSWYLIHAATVNCANPGDCRDYRSIGGVYGPGSLQVVLNERTGEGFFDYDDFSPYDGWKAFVQHAGEI